MTEDITGISSPTILECSKVNSSVCKAENDGGKNKCMDKDDIEPPPDGGTTAWVQVALTHLVFFNTWGVTNSFGVFQSYYTEKFNSTQSKVSIIGSVQVCFLFLAGIPAGRATDAGHFRVTFGLGVLLQLAGLFMTSLGTKYWHILLSQAICLGLGNGLTFCPSLALLSSYFARRRAFAVGLAAAGAATGGLVYPVVVNQLLFHRDVDFGWTVRALGFIMLGTYVPCLLWFRTRLPPRSSGPLIDPSALREKPFLFFTASMFLNFWGLYFAFFYLGSFAKEKLHMSESINLLMILNGVGVIGRILPNLMGDRCTGMLNTLIPISFIASLLVYCWAAIHSVAGLYVFAVIYGLFAASLQALFPAVATTMTPDPSRTGTRVGMIFSTVSIATLTGPIICGALVQKGTDGYLYAEMFAASSIFLGAAMALLARITKVGLSLKTKV